MSKYGKPQDMWDWIVASVAACSIALGLYILFQPDVLYSLTVNVYIWMWIPIAVFCVWLVNKMIKPKNINRNRTHGGRK